MGAESQVQNGTGAGATGNVYQRHALREVAGTLGVLSPDKLSDVMEASRQDFLKKAADMVASGVIEETQNLSDAALDNMPALKSPEQMTIETGSGATDGDAATVDDFGTDAATKVVKDVDTTIINNMAAESESGTSTIADDVSAYEVNDTNDASSPATQASDSSSATTGSSSTTTRSITVTPDALSFDTSAGATTGTTTLTGAAAFIALLGRLMAILGANEINQLKNNAQLWNQLSTATRASLQVLGDTFDAAVAAAKKASNEADAAVKASNSANSNANTAQRAVNDAANQLNAAIKAGASADTISSLTKTYQAAVTNFQNANSKASQLAQVATDKLKAAVTAATYADQKETEMQTGVSKAVAQYNFHVNLVQSQALTGAAALTAIIGRLLTLISKSSIEQLEDQRKTMNALREKREEALQKKSDEYQKAVEKAEHMQKVMGCLGKILGAIITAVSVIAAAFTGGASLALAAVGLALFLSDEIAQAATGSSYLEKVFSPIMDAIVKPLMNLIASLVEKVLVAMGVDKDKAALGGMIWGAVATGVLLIAGAMVAGSALKSMVSKLMEVIPQKLIAWIEQTVGKMLSKMMTEITENSLVKGMSTRIGDALLKMRRVVGAETETEQMLLATRVQYGAEGLQIGYMGATSGVSIAISAEQNKASKLMALMKEAMADLQIISQLMNAAVDAFTNSTQAIMSLLQNMVDAGLTDLQTDKQILGHVRKTRSV